MSMHSKHSKGDAGPRRHAKLPGWVLVPGLALMAASFVSGVVIWWGQAANAAFDGTDGSGPFPTGGWVRFHGALNPFLCGFLGYLTAQHIRIGWRTRANVPSGAALLWVFAGLAASGTFLVYGGSEATRDYVMWFHRIAGLLLPVTLACHLVQVYFWVKNLGEIS